MMADDVGTAMSALAVRGRLALRSRAKPDCEPEAPAVPLSAVIGVGDMDRWETALSMRNECSSSERLDVSEFSSSTFSPHDESLSFRLDTISRNGRNSAP